MSIEYIVSYVYVHTMMPFPLSTATPRSAIAVGVNGDMNERGGGLCVDARPLLRRICAELLLYMS